MLLQSTPAGDSSGTSISTLMFCASLFLSGLNLHLCTALKPTLKLLVLHSDGKQSLSRTRSVDDFALNQGSLCI